MSPEKILSIDQLLKVLEQLRVTGMGVVFTNGCFDLLHVGHVRYLANARLLGDVLVVALNGDASVRALKGDGRPINPAGDRAEVQAALEVVNFVTVFDSPRVTEVIKELRPDIYVKGGDYTVESLDPGERAALEEVGTEIRIVPIMPGKSTTSLIEKMESAGAGMAKRN